MKQLALMVLPVQITAWETNPVTFSAVGPTQKITDSWANAKANS